MTQGDCAECTAGRRRSTQLRAKPVSLFSRREETERRASSSPTSQRRFVTEAHWLFTLVCLAMTLTVSWGDQQETLILVGAELLILIFGYLAVRVQTGTSDGPHTWTGTAIRSERDWGIHPVAMVIAVLLPLLVWSVPRWPNPYSEQVTVFGIVGMATVWVGGACLFMAWRSGFPPGVEIARAFGGGVQRLRIQPHVWLGILTIISLSVWLAMARGLVNPSAEVDEGNRSETQDQSADNPAGDSGKSTTGTNAPPDQPTGSGA